MKKTLSAVAVLCFLSSSAMAADGKINFTGSITDESCTVVNNVANPLEVTLGTVSSKAFTDAGSTAAATKFQLELTDCPASVTSASVKFDGEADSNVNTVLALTTANDMATGVGVQLADKNGKELPLYTASIDYPLVEGGNSLDFVARYYATADTVTAGKADATSSFTIIYN